MKKILSLVLSFLIILTCFSTVSFASDLLTISTVDVSVSNDGSVAVNANTSVYSNGLSTIVRVVSDTGDLVYINQFTVSNESIQFRFTPQIKNEDSTYTITFGSPFDKISTFVYDTDASIQTPDPKSTNADLSSLTVSSCSLTFNANTTSYTLNVENSVSSVNVTATVADTGKATMKINGTTQTSGVAKTVNLNTGSNTIVIAVTAEDGTTIKTYTITVNRANPVVNPTPDPKSTNADLSSLTVSSGSLTFNANTTSYTLNVENSVSSVNVTATVADTGKAIMKINGTTQTSGVAKTVNLNTGSNTIAIAVTAEDGTTIKTYTVTVNRANATTNPNNTGNTGDTGGNTGNIGDTDTNDPNTGDINTDKNLGIIVVEEDSTNSKQNEDGTTTIETKINDEQVEKALGQLKEKENKEVVIEVKGKSEKKNVELTSKSIQEMTKNKATLSIKTSVKVGEENEVDKEQEISLVIPTNIIDLDSISKDLKANKEDLSVRVSVESVNKTYSDEAIKNAEDNKVVVAPVLEFTIKVYTKDGNSKVIDDFGDNRVKGQIPYDKSKVKDAKKLNVYKYNEETKKWEHRRTIVDPETNVVTFYTKTFSKYTVMENNVEFSDINNHWAKNTVELMASKHIINGVGNNKFEPDRNITRAEFASLLVRALDLTGSKENVFNDVPNSAWYTESIGLAYSNGLISGVGNNNFAPSKSISRQEIAVMIIRAYKLTNKEKIDTSNSIAFKDSKDASSWALASVNEASALKLMSGNNSLFRPHDYTTRAEAATVLYNLLKELQLI